MGAGNGQLFFDIGFEPEVLISCPSTHPIGPRARTDVCHFTPFPAPKTNFKGGVHFEVHRN